MEDTTAMVAPETTGEAEQLIVIKQLPIIQEQLYMIKSQVEAVVIQGVHYGPVQGSRRGTEKPHRVC